MAIAVFPARVASLGVLCQIVHSATSLELTDGENRVETKHLEFIQAIISRLAGNSFQMKGWNVALATAAVGFAATKDARPTLAVLAVVPALAFWFLDSYYLTLERRYRELYKQAINAQVPLGLDAGSVAAREWFASAFRPSVVGLHAPMIGVILLVTVTGILR